MLDFSSVRNKETSLNQLAQGVTHADLKRLTNEMIDTQLALTAECLDADVVLVPEDPDAFDQAAATVEEMHMPWTLGHVIVHVTASSEEGASLAAELARGVPFHGRSRYEVPWQAVKTIEQCRRRLKESRRIRLASLDMWPDSENLFDDGKQHPYPGAIIKAKNRFLLGLMHDDAHLEQIRDIVRQAREARASGRL